MRAVVQRVSSARVEVAGRVAGAIDTGLLVLLGVHREDTMEDVTRLADKIVHLRVFEDEQGKMNHSLKEVGGAMLVVSQFTLLGDCRKGLRPSWNQAAPPEQANQLYLAFVATVEALGIPTGRGEFQAMMDVHPVNDGPVTLLLDSHRLF